MKLLLTISLLVLLFLNTRLVYSQERIQYSHFDNNHLKNVEFANGRTINAHSENPYLIDITAIYESSNHTVYNFSSSNKEAFDTYFANALLIDKDKSKEQIANVAVFTINCERYETYYAGLYLALIFNGSDQLIGCKSSIKLFNNQGDVVFNKNELAVAAYEINISTDGKYLAILSGHHWTVEENNLMPVGFMIWNTIEDRLLDSITDEDFPDYTFVGMSSNEDLIKLNLSNYELDLINLTFYSSKNEVKYTKEMARSDYFNLKEITNNGLIFKKNPSDTMFFKSDFQSHVLR